MHMEENDKQGKGFREGHAEPPDQQVKSVENCMESSVMLQKHEAFDKKVLATVYVD